MTEKQKNVANWELNVKESEARLAEARINLEQGMKKAQAEFEREHARLIREVNVLCIAVQRDRNCLAEARAILEKGFE